MMDGRRWSLRGSSVAGAVTVGILVALTGWVVLALERAPAPPRLGEAVRAAGGSERPVAGKPARRDRPARRRRADERSGASAAPPGAGARQAGRAAARPVQAPSAPLAGDDVDADDERDDLGDVDEGPDDGGEEDAAADDDEREGDDPADGCEDEGVEAGSC